MKQSKDAQILDLTNTVTDLTAKVEDLEKKLKSSEATKDSWYRSMNEKEAQLKALHDLLDVLPDPTSRKTGTDDEPDYSRRDRSVMERLVAFLVRK